MAAPAPQRLTDGDRARLAGLDRRGVIVGLVLVVLLLAGVYFGSQRLRWFDAALSGYLAGTVLATFAVAYRYIVWISRPPTRALRRRGWQAFWARGRRLRSILHLPDVLWTHIVGQGFIRRRSASRWIAHQCLFWGCLLAALVTFPLTFGWLHFQSVGQDAKEYQAYVIGIGTAHFQARSPIGWLAFHALDIAAVLVLTGVLIFLIRRLRDPGAIAVERSNDFLALAGLFAVSVTGLMLTVDSLWLDGRFYIFLTTVHAATVILGLLYIPFSKLFHIFQRPGTVGLAYTKAAWAHEDQAICAECGQPYAAATQVADLRATLPAVGFDYGDYQTICPPCRRHLVALAQSARVGGFG